MNATEAATAEPNQEPKPRPFMEAMRAKAELGDIQTADDFYTWVHKTDLKRLLRTIDTLHDRLRLSLTVALNDGTTRDILDKLFGPSP